MDANEKQKPATKIYQACKIHEVSSKATSNDEGIRYFWSDDNLKEVELGILKRANTLEDLAQLLGLDPAAAHASIERWNSQCGRGADEDFGRPSGSMMPLKTPPF